MHMQPKILFVTSHWPLDHAYGAQQRSLNIAKLLGRLGDVSLVVVPPEPENAEIARRTAREFPVRLVARPLPLAKGNLFHRLRQRFGHEFDPAHLATVPYAVSESDRRALLDLMQQHDVTWVHSVFVANLFRIRRWPSSVLDVDDIPSRLYVSSAQVARNPVRRLVDLRMSWIWRRREHLFTERFDAVTVCSKDDQRYLGGDARIHVVPNGFNPPAVIRRGASESLRIGFIGTCNWLPNTQGVKWFIRYVWPLIRREIPRAQLRLVGLSSDGELAKLASGIAGLGFLGDPSDEIASWSAMIVPIQFGAGTRIKIAEGFARRCPVVSTSLGAFGYDVRNGEELLLADRAGDFASACVKLLRNPEMGEALAERAHSRFLQQWTWDSFASSVGAAIQECLTRRSQPRTEPGIVSAAL
jgi:glycosyltransferase involved in cell wall biosynthesis